MLRLQQIAGHVKPVHRHELNPAWFVKRSADIEPEALAVVYGEKRYTYAEFANRVCALAWYFKRQGLKRVAICAPNTPAHLETMFAANVAGAIVMGLNYRLSKREIQYKLDLGEADCVVVDPELEELVAGFNGHKIVDDGQYEQIVNTPSSWEGLDADPHEEDVLGYFFTSGTTGMPKAVEYTYRGVYLAAMANIVESRLNCQDLSGEGRCRYLWTLPMFHAAGWTYPYAVTAVRGTHYCLRKIEPEKIWDILHQERITHFNAAPTVNTMLVNSPNASKLEQQVRVIVAASPPSAQLFHDMYALNLFPVHMYGLTETYGPFTMSYYNPAWNSLPHQDRLAKLARQGYAFITSDSVRVVKDGRDVERDGQEIGEIITRGNIVTRGYYNNTQETAKAFQEYFHSGDLAVVHADGSIQVLDRKKDIIISGGENISSVVVESVVVKHPAVLEAAVVGVPDDLYGELPVACVVLKQGHQLKDAELVEFAKQELGGFQVPRRVVIYNALPKTATGKVRKNVLRDELK